MLNEVIKGGHDMGMALNLFNNCTIPSRRGFLSKGFHGVLGSVMVAYGLDR
jgi:hypothetical protein